LARVERVVGIDVGVLQLHLHVSHRLPSSVVLDDESAGHVNVAIGFRQRRKKQDREEWREELLFG
jgi:hypothetical protein